MKIEFAKNYHHHPESHVQIGSGLFAPRAEWANAPTQTRHRALVDFYAQRLKNPAAVFSGVSGAVLRGIPVLGSLPVEPRCYSDTKRGATLDLVKWRYSAKLPPFDLIDGVKVACVERVLVDLCVEFDAVACLVALNHCVFTRQTNVRRLKAYAEKHPGIWGIRRMVKLLPFANAMCESPLETLGWLSVYQNKLILPRQQIEFRLPRDCKTRFARVDMCWRVGSDLLAVELDGKVKYQTQEDLVNEKIREDELRRQGCKVLRFLWEDVRSEKMVARLRDAGVRERRYMGRTIPHW